MESVVSTYEEGTPPLFALWQCQSKDFTKEEGDPISLSNHTVTLNWNQQ